MKILSFGNIYRNHGRGKVWRKVKLENMISTVQYGARSVMDWGSVAAAGVETLHFVEGRMDQMKYIQILRAKL